MSTVKVSNLYQPNPQCRTLRSDAALACAGRQTSSTTDGRAARLNCSSGIDSSGGEGCCCLKSCVTALSIRCRRTSFLLTRMEVWPLYAPHAGFVAFAATGNYIQQEDSCGLTPLHNCIGSSEHPCPNKRIVGHPHEHSVSSTNHGDARPPPQPEHPCPKPDKLYQQDPSRDPINFAKVQHGNRYLSA